MLELSIVSLINILFISIGIGICALCMLTIGASVHLRKEVRLYFLIFFGLILGYIVNHLAREIMNGLPGVGVRIALYIVTFIEMACAGVMSHMMYLLVMVVTKNEKKLKPLVLIMYAFLAVHVILLLAGGPFGLIYKFDENNVYQRGTFYLLSNLAPVVFLITNIVLLIVYRKNVQQNVKLAFWIYMIAPIVAIAVQSFLYGVQLIIFATVGSAVYMFGVIIGDQNSRYTSQQQEKSRIETELSMASSIQADMLPNVYPAFPERPEFDVFASMDPAKEVGGDFYDFFLIDDDHLCLVIADVSGKGVPAALFMMASKIILSYNAINTKSPAAVLTNTNNAICSNNREEMFVTVWLGILELSTGKLKAANAGHEFPILNNNGDKYEVIKDHHGFVIGGMSGMPYTEYELTLKPGAKLFIYTDGVPEASNSKRKLFGIDRLVEALNQDVTLDPKATTENVRKAVDDFVEKAEQFDDLTMLCLKYNGPQK